MTDYKLPDLPSDDELGITDEDREKYGEEDEGSELSAEERRMLGLDDPEPKAPPDGGEPPKARKKKKTKKGKEAPSPPPPPPPGDEPPKAKAKERPPEAPGPRSRWRGPAMLVALLASAWLTSAQRTVPRPVAANAPDTVFSSARAMAMDVEIARRAHPTGSPEQARVREYVLGRLRDLGLDPQVQTTTAMIGRGSRVRAATVRNVVARVPGTASTGAVLLLAHYDAAGIALGAGDDGAGVVAILESLRALGAGAPLQNDLIVLITDAEELGLLGAQAFVDEHPWMQDVKVVLNFEMRGGAGPSIMFETGDQNGWVVQAMRSAGIRPWTNSFSYEVYKRLPNDTDFTRFREAGKQGLNFGGISRASVYHQTYDDPSNLSEAILQHHGDNLLGMTRWLGNTSLAQVDAPDQTYFTIPWLGVFAYSGSLVLAVAAWIALLAVLVLLGILRGGGRWPGLLVGFGLGLVSTGLTGALGWALMRWLPRFHLEWGALVGSAFHHEGWYMAALVGAALTIVTALFGVARRWVGAASLMWGALAIPLAIALFLSIEAPLAAATFQWPVTAAYFGIGTLLLKKGPRTATISWVLSLLLAASVLVFMTPAIELLWLGLSFRAAMQLGVLVTLALILLLPALDHLREPNAWWAPVATLVAAAACLGIGIRMASPTPELPAPSTLAWAYDHGSGEALWVTRPDAAPDAEAWAAGAAGAQLTQARAMAPFGYRDTADVGAAPAPDVPPLQAWVVADSMAGAMRRVRLALRSAIGAEEIQLRFPEAGGTRILAVNGRALPVQERATLVEHWGDPAPALLVDLELPQGAAIDMDVVEQLLHPGNLVGAQHFQRPPELAPNVVWMSDRAMVRTPASALALQYGTPPFAAGDAALGGVPVPAEPLTAPADSAAATGADTASAPDSVGGTALPDTMPAAPDTSAVPDTTGVRS